MKHPRFFAGWVRGLRWDKNLLIQPDNANILFQFFTDGTLQPVFNTHHKLITYYAGGDFSMQSTGTARIHTASRNSL